MQKMAVLPNARLAQAFVDYAAAHKVAIELAPEADAQVALWLVDDSQAAWVEQELARFVAEPMHSRYQAASWQVAETRYARFHYPSAGLWQTVKDKSGPVTITVMIACAALFAMMILGGFEVVVRSLLFPADSEQRWQLWRLFSHALLHFSALHIVFNLLWWWVLGGRIEQRAGGSKLMQIFLFAALFSGLGQYWLEGPYFGGLSGVVYALLGYLWWLTWLAPERGLTIEKPYVVFMLAWLVIGFFQPLGMNIANMAHVFGLGVGCLLGLWDAKRAA
ncbi:rhomboid family intramembrane serine protease GlpG [Salinivibrio costicola]|uniref:Rhomboid family intramembrane serine protease GlpG n=1 Tax=Salinivibrio costicola TaxID=51367 RepID=A0ABX6K073_SALCS|nr:rhomboid family intramembrane serine protease GlpG [Salinivibrio costicola]QIR04977.1 rhomboid family intramembrane serine protease GlpG [Salinivibrio costicola]